jgi:hypothetical protein
MVAAMEEKECVKADFLALMLLRPTFLVVAALKSTTNLHCGQRPRSFARARER